MAASFAALSSTSIPSSSVLRSLAPTGALTAWFAPLPLLLRLLSAILQDCCCYVAQHIFVIVLDSDSFVFTVIFVHELQMKTGGWHQSSGTCAGYSNKSTSQCYDSRSCCFWLSISISI